MGPLSVPNFIPIRVRIRVLWRILPSVRNEEDEEEKNEEIILFIFISFISLLYRYTVKLQGW